MSGAVRGSWREAGQQVLYRKNAQVSPLVAATMGLHAVTLPAPSRGAWDIALCWNTWPAGTFGQSAHYAPT